VAPRELRPVQAGFCSLSVEDYDAQGMRIVTYGSVLLGSTMGLGRIFDITNAAITA